MLTHPSNPAPSSVSSMVAISLNTEESTSNTGNQVQIASSGPEIVHQTARKKARKTNPGILESPRKLALEDISTCEIIVDGPAKNGKRKRSRKQTIDTLSEQLESNVKPEPVKKLKAQRKKHAVIVSCSTTTSSSLQSTVSKFENGYAFKNSDEVFVNSSVSPLSTETISSPSTDNYLQDVSTFQRDLANTNITFTNFPDLSRNITAIGPSQVVIAVDTIHEPGKEEDCTERSGDVHNSNWNWNNRKNISHYSTTPYYLPLKSVYSSGEPFTRVLKFSQLEEYTEGKQENNHVAGFRFTGSRYEKPMPLASPSSENDLTVNKDGYFRSDFVIKHPLLEFHSRKLVSLKFIVLKRIIINSRLAFAILKAKIVQLRRSADLKNIEIYVDETGIPEVASDVNAMSHQNSHPVIQTSSGLVPVIRTSNNVFQAQHTQQHNQYRYVVHETLQLQENSAVTNSGYYTLGTTANAGLSSPGIGGEYFQTDFRSENPAQTQLVIINDGQSSDFLPHSQAYSEQLSVEQRNHHQAQLTFQVPAQSHHFHQPAQPHHNFSEQQQQFYRIPQQQQTVQVQHTPVSQPVQEQQEETVLGHILLDPSQLGPGPNFQFIIDASVPVNVGGSPVKSITVPVEQLQLQQHQIPQSSYVAPSLPSTQQIFIRQDSNFQQQQQILHSNTIQTAQYSSTTQNQVRSITSIPHSEHEPLVRFNQQQPRPVGIPQASVSYQPQQLPEPVDPTRVYLPPQQQIYSPAHVPASSPSKSSKPKGTKAKRPKNNNFNPQNEPRSNILQAAPIFQSKPSERQPLHKLHQSVRSVIQSTPGGGVSGPVPGSNARIPATHFTTASLSSPSAPGTHVTSTGGTVYVAAKSQTQSANSAHALTPNSSNSTNNSSRTITVVSNSPIPTATTSLPEPVIEPPVRKPGFVAVCTHCGTCSQDVSKCSRCKRKFPEDVKLVKDSGWTVDKHKAAVAVVQVVQQQTKKPPAPGPVVPPPSDNKTLNSKQNEKLVVTTTPLQTKVAKKIIVVNKPAILNNCVNSKAVGIGAGTLQIQIQQDGGSAVTFVTSASGNTTKPVAKKRAPPKRKQQECITLSSDEEEAEPKISKIDVTATSSNQSVSNTDSAMGNTSSGAGKDKVVAAPEEKRPSAKKITINLSLEEGAETSKATLLDNEPPEKVLARIEELVKTPGGKRPFAMVECRSIRVGSYKFSQTDIQCKIPVTFTEFGMKFTIPYSSIGHRNVQICIPANAILSFKVCFNKKLPVFFIITGPKYATWVREHLGLDGSPSLEASNYYCPTNGCPSQKSIVILADAIGEADIGLIRSMFKNDLTEIEFAEANDILMKITTKAYKNSIDYNSPSRSPTNVKSTAGEKSTPTTSKSGTSRGNSSVVTPSTSTRSNDKESKMSEGSQDVAASQVTVSSTSTSNAEHDGPIVLYEGRNNIKVPICAKDLRCLGYAEFLNDQIIDFWLAVIQTEILSEKDKGRTFVFDSFFYSKLTEKVKKRTAEESALSAGERRHARVKKRTKNVDIFDKDFLIIPINENYHWYIAIICFPGLQGYCDFETLEALPNYNPKRLKISVKPTSSGSSVAKKPIVSAQPKSGSTASYSDRDEAPEDPEEMEDSEGSAEESFTSQTKCQSPINKTDDSTTKTVSIGAKRKIDSTQRVKHPCILVFDSLAGDARGRVYSTLREYLKIEYKTKKNVDRTFDKLSMPGFMPKVPQQPNFSDCGIYMLQYVESFFSHPIPNFETKEISLKTWFDTATAVNKRQEIFNFILKKVEERSPNNLSRIPHVNFEPNDDDPDGSLEDGDDDDDSDYLFEAVKVKRKKSEDHNYAKGVIVVNSSTNVDADEPGCSTPVITSVSSMASTSSKK